VVSAVRRARLIRALDCFSVNGGNILISADRLTDLAQTRLDYWNGLIGFMRQRNSSITFNNPNSKHQLRARADSFGSGEFILVALAIVKPDPLIGVGLEISGPKEYYAALADDGSKIQSEIDSVCGEKQKLQWNPETKVRDIWLYRQVDFSERRRWVEQHEWLCERLEAFRKVLKPRVVELLHAAS
jgi:hypothetical protein